MMNKLRRYRVHGRTTHERYPADDSRQYEQRPTELMVTSFEDPPTYENAIRLDFGKQNRDGGWINLPDNTVNSILNLLNGEFEANRLATCHDGVCVDVQPNPEHQRGINDIQKTVLEIHCITTPSESKGCNLILGSHEAAGADLILTSAQTTDFINVLEGRLSGGEQYQPKTNGLPTIIDPDGTPQ